MLRYLCALLGGGAMAACSFNAAVPTYSPQHASLGRPVKGVGYLSLYSFGQNGKMGDGMMPDAKLIPFDGALYGTTQFGGMSKGNCFLGCGIVFRMLASGAEEIVYRFKGGADGIGPAAALIALGGALYGTTSQGGAGGCRNGCGTVFRLIPGKSESVIYSFKGGKDGAKPVARLVAFAGALYGTTEYGGTHSGSCFNGCGTIFAVSPSKRTERVVYRFKGGKDGALPTAGLGANRGALYGTTQYGGLTTRLCSIGCGTVFRVDPNGAERILHAFAPGSGDGAYPAADLIVVNGTFYGTTYAGGKASAGTLFRLDPASGRERVIYAFYCCPRKHDGAAPLARLLNLNGTLYGTTRKGGAGGLGTVYAVTTTGSERVLYSFAGKPDGEAPLAGLTAVGGFLYGTAAYGGTNSEGTVFRLVP